MRILTLGIAAACCISTSTVFADPLTTSRLKLACPAAYTVAILPDGRIAYSYTRSEDESAVEACLRTAMDEIATSPYPVNTGDVRPATRASITPSGTIRLE